MAKEFSFEIMEEIAVLSENAKGWKKELNLVSRMAINQNLIYEIGMRLTKKWEKG